jgi:hypothetical protein
MDGRSVLEARKTTLSFPDGSPGSAEASIGKTRSVASNFSTWIFTDFETKSASSCPTGDGSAPAGTADGGYDDDPRGVVADGWGGARHITTFRH